MLNQIESELGKKQKYQKKDCKPGPLLSSDQKVDTCYTLVFIHNVTKPFILD